MKYYSRSNMYKSGTNLSLNAETLTATSYDWYILSKQYDSTLVVNTYNYSNTTVRHYYKLMKQLRDLNKSYVTIQAPKGLQDLGAAKAYYESLIANLKTAINKKGTRHATNLRRLSEIKGHYESINLIDRLLSIKEGN